MSEETKTVDEESEDLFYFESDHVALKGNKDYCELLKTIAILEAQRAQAIKDIDKLIGMQKNALEDPYAFLEKIKNKEDLQIPCAQVVAEIPLVNWSKYNAPVPVDGLKLINTEEVIDYKKILSPRKPKTKDNSSTYNKPWTSEEQKKLEELLVKFPPEAIEMRRFQKIANALGNRSVKQVTSRVQKYFLKLYKAGLPIPGRIPKTLDKKKSSHRHQRHNYLLYKPSTFFPESEVPVYMTENDDDLPGPTNTSFNDFFEGSCNKPLDSSEITEKGEVQLKIDLLKKIKIIKMKETNQPSCIHIGFKCDICNEEPINGCRWHCTDCKQDSIDFCTDCLVAQLHSAKCHPLSHNLIPLQHEDGSFTSNSSNLTSIDATGSSISSASYNQTFNTEIKSDNESSTSDSDDSDLTSTWNSTVGYNSEDDNPASGMKDYDEDYVSETFTKDIGKYNYLDPNFLPE